MVMQFVFPLYWYYSYFDTLSPTSSLMPSYSFSHLDCAIKRRIQFSLA